MTKNKFKTSLCTVISTVLSAIAVMVSIYSVNQTNKNMINNTQMQIATHIIDNRPTMSAGTDIYSGNSKILALSQNENNDVKNKELPYIENSSNNVAQNVVIMAIYKSPKSSKSICEYAQLSSIFPKEKIFINSYPLKNNLKEIKIQYYSTAKEKIQQTISFKNKNLCVDGNKSNFITSNSTFYDYGKNIKYVKDYNNSNEKVDDIRNSTYYEYSINNHLDKNIDYKKLFVFE